MTFPVPQVSQFSKYLQEFQDCDNNVIDVTESRGLEFLRMMKSSGPVDGDVALAVVELNRSVHGGSGVARTAKSFQKAFFTLESLSTFDSVEIPD